MKAIRQILPYLKGKWGYVAAYGISNLLSVVFSTLTVTMIGPFLTTLFDKAEKVSSVQPMSLNSKQAIENYFKYLMTHFIEQNGGDKVYGLIFICLVVVFATFFKNVFLYTSRYILNPLRNGILFNIRKDLFGKIIQLPIGFFTNERKGDIMSRMTNDVSAVEVSIISMMELLFSTPITIVFYFQNMRICIIHKYMPIC